MVYLIPLHGRKGIEARPQPCATSAAVISWSMTTESTFIGLMRAMATDPAARGLLDDTAVVELDNESLILTHDMMAEGVHFRSNADPADVAWKLVASNLSDLAAKGARPCGILLGFMLGDDDWDRRFAAGLQMVLAHYSVPLLGGDTVANRGDKRALGLTAIGTATHRPVPSRSGAQPGDLIYVTGTLGDALAGYELIDAGFDEVGPLAAAFNRPEARLSEGQSLAPLVHAMMDISDGLLLDADRYVSYRGETLESRMQAATWGDDYELLCAASPDAELPDFATCVGRILEGGGVQLQLNGQPVDLPPSLGYQHNQ
jgi:thiamine-monophosphate kinase